LSPSAVTATSKPSFAHAVRGPQAQFSDPLPTPSVCGDRLSIKIMNEAYARGIETCKVKFGADYY